MGWTSASAFQLLDAVIEDAKETRKVDWLCGAEPADQDWSKMRDGERRG